METFLLLLDLGRVKPYSTLVLHHSYSSNYDSTYSQLLNLKSGYGIKLESEIIIPL